MEVFTAISRRGALGWRSAPSSRVAALRFTCTPGPLLAVVALCGGAGASTLAYLIGVAAAASSSVPILVCDTGGPTAGLALYANARAGRTLAETAQRLADGLPLSGGLFALGESGLRVLAGEPQFTVPGDRQGVRRVLSDARAAHGLSVLDAGTLSREADQAAFGLATHVAWVLPASETGVLRARRALDRIASLTVPEMILARAEPGVRRPPMKALAGLAEDRRAPLVLTGHVELPREASRAVETAGLALQAIGGWLHR